MICEWMHFYLGVILEKFRSLNGPLPYIGENFRGVFYAWQFHPGDRWTLRKGGFPMLYAVYHRRNEQTCQENLVSPLQKVTSRLLFVFKCKTLALRISLCGLSPDCATAAKRVVGLLQSCDNIYSEWFDLASDSSTWCLWEVTRKKIFCCSCCGSVLTYHPIW